MYSISYVDDLPCEIYQHTKIDINRHGQLDPVLIQKQSINVLMSDEYI